MIIKFSELRWVNKPDNGGTETNVVFGNPYNRIHRDDAGLFVMKRGKQCLVLIDYQGKVY